MALGWLHWPEQILKEAWIDDGKCVLRQLARELGKSMEEIELETPSANAVLQYCKGKGYPCHVLHSNRVIARSLGNKRKAICFQIFENHCYFYFGNEAKRAIAHLPLREGPAQTPEWKLERVARQRKTGVKAFEAVFWQGLFTPGSYHCIEDEMVEVRREFLNSGRCPKVVLSSTTRIRALEYHCG